MIRIQRRMFALLAGLSLAAVQGRGDDGYIITRPQRTLEQIDALYAEMKPLDYGPPADRWERLPRTARLLAGGPRLRIVMLGDSIVNDTSRSAWQLLVDRDHPRCEVSTVTSVRGSTGCWWYKEEGRVRRFVLDHEPDLVIIGGISQRDDIDSIREVIGQIRAQSEAEILLLTGAFGRVDPNDERWPETPDPDGDDYRARLRRLAEEQRTAFLDLEAVWGRYVRQSQRPVDEFKRDVVHANARGEQILGRALAQFLSQPDDR